MGKLILPLNSQECIHHFFETQCTIAPEKIAIIDENIQLTYQELNEQANQFSYYLQSLSKNTPSLVGVYLPRSVFLLTVLLGILKSGAAYVPLDITYPKKRLSYILEDTKARILITHSQFSKSLPKFEGTVIYFDHIVKEMAAFDKGNNNTFVTGNNLAYVIYTSGSTGTPKGVEICHKNTVSFLCWAKKIFLQKYLKRVFASTSICFDLSIFELFLPISTGGSIVIGKDFKDIAYENIKNKDITLINTVPSILKAFLLGGGVLPNSVKIVNLAGEPLSLDLVTKIYSIKTIEKIYNLYGPTETTTYSTFNLISRNLNRTPTIGRPIDNTQVYLLNKSLRKVTKGEVGEIFIAGAGVAKGYLNLPELTKARFISDPFSKAKNTLMYKTGDLGRYLSDGTIEYLGRNDQQVKFHGIRIELGEIEVNLRKNSAIAEAKVLAMNKEDQSQILVAFIIKKKVLFDSDNMHKWLEQRIPHYMIPQLYITLNKMPLTPSGKIDIQKLTEIAHKKIKAEGQEIVLPQTKIEKIMTMIWTKLLKKDRIGIHDNFFSVGGESLLILQMLLKIKKALHVELSFSDIFSYPTIAELSHYIDEGSWAKGKIPLLEKKADSKFIASYAQELLWLYDRLEPNSPTYNIVAAMELDDVIDEFQMKRAIEGLMQRHEMLRVYFEYKDGQLLQKFLSNYFPPIHIVEILDSQQANHRHEIKKIVNEEVHRPFDLTEGPLFRVLIIKGQKASIFVLTMHHIIADEWSLDIIMRDLSSLYLISPSTLSIDHESLLAYSDFATWQRQWMTEKQLDNLMRYWDKQLDALPMLNLPTDCPRPAIQDYVGRNTFFESTPKLSKQIRILAREQQTTLFNVLLSAFAILLGRYSGQEDFAIGSPISGRHYLGVEEIVGFFINPLALRMDLSENPSFLDLLKRNTSLLMDAYQHQDLPFGLLLQRFSKDRDLSRTPFYQVMLTMHGEPPLLNLPFVKVKPLSFRHRTAKFDLDFIVADCKECLKFELRYNINLFSPKTIHFMKKRWLLLLENIVADPNHSIWSIDLLGKKNILNKREDTYHKIITTQIDTSINMLFKKHVSLHPHKTAIQTENFKWTYKKLNQEINRIAWPLLKNNHLVKTQIAILCDEPASMIACMFAILSSGNCYVPLDVNNPSARLSKIIDDAKISAIITDHTYYSLAQNITRELNILILNVDELPRKIFPDVPIKSTADSYAYILYTSGTTGSPKGVLQNHRNILYFNRVYTQSLQIQKNDKLVSFASFCFDAAVMDIYGALLNGATLYPFSIKQHLPEEVLAWIKSQKITIYHSTPTVFRYLLSEGCSNFLKTLRFVVLGGEEVQQKDYQLYQKHCPKKCLFVNGFGPTEATISLQYFLDKKNKFTSGSVPLGYPVSGTEILLLNRYGTSSQLYGEIGIKSPYLALQYWNKPNLTTETFIDLSGRLYRTGDLGRLLSNGAIEFIGRSDDQVKVRGYRIELSEITTSLLNHPQIKEAVCIAKRDHGESIQLIAYYIGENVTSQELAKYLKQLLPDYMMPSFFVAMNQFPLTPNGKIDYAALPDVSLVEAPLTEVEATNLTPIQKKLLLLWKELLNSQSIRIEDNFFEIGGHSLLATQMLSRIRREFNVELPLRNLFSTPTIAGLAELIAQFEADAQQEPEPLLIPIAREGVILASFAQQRIWFLSQLDPDTPLYNLSQCIYLKGELRISALKKAFETLVQRHESLRTTFKYQDEQVVQLIHKDALSQLEVQRFDHITEQEWSAQIQKQSHEEAIKLFDLSKGPLIRYKLLCFSKDYHVLLLNFSHIIADGWSLNTITHELSILYNAYIHNSEPQLPSLFIQYADYAVWQRLYLQGRFLDQQRSYWINKLSNAPEILSLPTDYTRTESLTNEGARYNFIVDPKQFKKLEHFSKKHNVTLFMSFLAVFQILLYRYTHQEDIMIGTPIANRTRVEMEDLIGCFVNTIVLRGKLNDDLTFLSFLEQIRSITLEAYTHQDLPFEQLVELLKLSRNTSRNPLFQVMLVLHNTALSSFRLDGLETKAEDIDTGMSLFDITLSLEPYQDSLLATVEYNTHLFKKETIVQFSKHFERLLFLCLENPHQKISLYPLLSNKEQEQLLYHWNKTTHIYPKDKTIHALFEKSVRLFPNNIALVKSNQTLSYQELNDKSTQLAHYLKKYNIGPESIVGVCLERSIELVITIFGVLKTGASYLPLDISYPQERLEFMLEDSGASLLISHSKFKPTFKLSIPNIELDLKGFEVDQESTQNISIPMSSSNRAYVMYTSGSTGLPKGVEVEHRSVVNTLTALQNKYPLQEEDAYLLKTTYTFDDSVAELFGWFWAGGRLVLLEKGEEKDIEKIIDTININNITHIRFVPSVLDVILTTRKLHKKKIKPILKYLFIGGEYLSKSLVKRLKVAISQQTMLINTYGLTETSIDSLDFNVSHSYFSSQIPLGKPLPNVKAYILDHHLQPVPIGVAGELYIGGEGLARGYLNRSNLNKKRFLNSDFSGVTKIYKTGDICRFLHDGNIEYLGRTDFQVKIRGIRIELGEIENCLIRHPEITKALVTLDKSKGLDQLIAYYVPDHNSSLSENEIWQFLGTYLPEVMIPNFFIPISEIPLTSSGKIDRNALPPPTLSELNKEIYVAPRNSLETFIATIWSDLLRQPKISINQNFFLLGGHSLLATQVVSRLNNEFNIEVPLRVFFKYPNIAGLARYISALTKTVKDVSVFPVSRKQVIPLSFAQQRLWFIDQFEHSSLYNISIVFKLDGLLNTEKFQEALDILIKRHEILRTRFEIKNGKPHQVILPSLHISLPIFDLTTLMKREQYYQIKQSYQQEVFKEFDLEKSPLLRGQLFKLSDNQYILILSIHHIISDGWSISILTRDLAEIYQALINVTEPNLPKLKVQYADFACWQQKLLKQARLKKQLKFWLKHLKNAPPFSSLPTDYVRPSVQTYHGRTYIFTIPKNLTKQLKNFNNEHQVTLFMTLLSALYLLLYRYTGQEDIVVGTTVANRNQLEIEELIGFFANTLALHAHIENQFSFRQLLGQVKKNVLRSYDNQDFPFEKLINYLKIERNLSYEPVFQILFVLQNVPALTIKMGNVKLTELNIADIAQLSKYDMTWYLNETQNGITVELEYRSSLFEEETIKRISTHWQILLNEIIKYPEQRISDLQLVTAVERTQQLVTWNKTQQDYPQEKTLPELFEAVVDRYADTIALVANEDKLTYHAFNERANQVAHYLTSLGMKTDSLIAVYLDRSIELVIALWGILKSGASFLPLDPDYPKERLEFMVKDSGAALLITTSEYYSEVQNLPLLQLQLDTKWNEISNQPTSNLSVPRTSSQRAYVLYTSGSTGLPKGVEVTHRNIVNTLTGLQRKYPLNAMDAYLLKTHYTFDVALTELFGWFWSDGRLVILEKGGEKDARVFFDTLKTQHITHINFVPSLLQGLLEIGFDQEMLSSLKYVFIAGEALSVQLVKALDEKLSQETKIINLYGPTEATIYATSFDIDRTKIKEIPIGKPLQNVEAYILDEGLHVVPVGVIGELYLGGESIATGYLNRLELTAERFIPHPFKKNARLYKTGDQCRFLQDGTIVYMGRSDFQVKLRGMRVELGEIEACLLAHSLVKAAVVVVHEYVNQKQLIAYVALKSSEKISSEELTQYLRQHLPSYMVPVRFIFLEAFPLLPSGKIDRQSLPPFEKEKPQEEYVPPKTDVEKIIVRVWEEVLHQKSISVEDNFFALGGDSIQSIQIVARCQQAGLLMSPKDIFLCQTPAQLAKKIKIPSVVRQELKDLEGDVPLTPIQLWFFEQHLKNPNYFNQAVLLKPTRHLDITLLQQALNYLINHHDALRLRFMKIRKSWRQYYSQKNRRITVKHVKLKKEKGCIDFKMLKQKASDFQASLNISAGPIIQVVFFDAEELNLNRLLIVIHHLVIDGVSWRILLEDLETVYLQLIQDKKIEFAAKTTSYLTWSKALSRYTQNPDNSNELNYWMNLSKQKQSYLPIDKKEGDNTVASSRTIEVNLSIEDTTDLIRNVPKHIPVQINDLLLTALIHSFATWSGEESLWIDLEGHGREEIEANIDISRTIGWFTSLFPVCLERHPSDDVKKLLLDVKEKLRRIPNKGIGFGIFKYLDKNVNFKQNMPTPEVSFNYLGQLEFEEKGLFQWAKEEIGSDWDLENKRTHLVDINGWISEGFLTVQWTYSKGRHNHRTILRWANNFILVLQQLIKYCLTSLELSSTRGDLRETSVDKQYSNLYSLTPLQSIMLQASKSSVQGDPYFIQSCYLLEGALDSDCYQQAWQKVIQRHDILRTSFPALDENTPLQAVHKTVSLFWQEHDWTGLSKEQQNQCLQDFLYQDRERGFHLADAPLLRFNLFHLGINKNILLWSYHHLIIDGWSLSIIWNEVLQLHDSGMTKKVIELPPSLPFWKVITNFEQKNNQKSIKFWKNYLKGVKSLPENLQPFNALGYKFHQTFLDKKTTQKLQQKARSHSVTLNHIFQAGWCLTLGKSMQTTDIVVGIVFSGRDSSLAGVETLVGPCINIVPLRMILKNETRITQEFVTQLKNTHIAIEQYQFTSLRTIQENLGITGRLFESLLYFENYPDEQALLQGQNVGISKTLIDHVEMNHYPISLWVIPENEQLTIKVGHQENYFPSKAVMKIVETLTDFLVTYADH